MVRVKINKMKIINKSLKNTRFCYQKKMAAAFPDVLLVETGRCLFAAFCDPSSQMDETQYRTHLNFHYDTYCGNVDMIHTDTYET